MPELRNPISAMNRRYRRVEFERNGGDDELPYPQRRQHQKRYPGNKHRAQRRLPRHAHLLHHRVGEIRVEAHPRRQRNRITRQRAHQDAAHRRGKTGRRRNRRQRHAGLMQNGRIHEDDVRHRHKGGEPGQYLGLPVGVEPLELEVALQARAHRHGLF